MPTNKLYKIQLIIIYGLIFFFAGAMTNHHKPGKGVKRIVINAGHGGKDEGTSGLFAKEKDVALKIATKLGLFIKNKFRDEIEVLYTREDDRFVELNEIAAHANKSDADFFISIHCNANPNKEAYGAETYVMGLHKTKGNLEVAKRENASILLEDNYQKKYDGFDPNSEEATIIFSMYQNIFLERSLSFAAKVQHNFKNIAKRFDRGVKQAGFLVLWKTKMPSVLIETGFLSNKEEEKFLASEKGQNQLAYSIFCAFREYKYEQEGKTLSEQEKHEKMPADFEFTEEELKQFSNPDKETKEPQKETKENILTDHKIDSKTDNSKENNKSDNTTNKAENPSASNTVNIPPTDNTKVEFAEYGIIFKIQLAGTEKKINVKKHFKDISEEIQEVTTDNGYRYYTGKFKTIEEARKYQEQLKEKGYKDIFIVAFQNGKRLTTSEAIEILKNKNQAQ
jgi:N-acetylmuramoyl-L-alanine amidase